MFFIMANGQEKSGPIANLPLPSTSNSLKKLLSLFL